MRHLYVVVLYQQSFRFARVRLEKFVNSYDYYNYVTIFEIVLLNC